MTLIEYLSNYSDFKAGVNLFFDIETFQYNKKAGYKHPSDFKNQVYSVAVSFYFDDNNIQILRYPTFLEFFDELTKSVKVYQKLKRVNLIAHNSNKFDNHYLLAFLTQHYSNVKHGSSYLRQAIDNDNAITKKSLKDEKNYILEKRVKSKTNLELDFMIDGVEYKTIDTYPKSGNRSLRDIGFTMKKLGILSDDHLKTSLVYDKYDSDDDMSLKDAHDKAVSIFNSLDASENKYIDNDVIILAEFWRNYNRIYPGFDIDKITFSQNVLEEYKTTPLSIYQLTNKVGKLYMKYTDYSFNGVNVFDYIKRFYKGGLNVYNDKYIGKIINGTIKSYDLNSSYPYVMYHFKIPTYLINTYESQVMSLDDLDDDNYFYMYEVTISTINTILNHIKSKMIRKIIVKYYNGQNENIYINSNTLRMINMYSDVKLKNIKFVSAMKWQCVYFDARNVIADNYFIKAQGKNTNKIIMHDPTNIEISNEKAGVKLSKEEIYICKVILNGLYGLPALRPYYNLYTYDNYNDVIDSKPNGFKNTERNMIFSTFVTSQALYNLLLPLSSVPPDMIDNYFYYADTDSLYLDDEIVKYISPDIIDKFNLGYWDNEHTMDKFYILNHKKYAYHDSDGIDFRCGGIPKSNFDTNMSFEQFINTQFSSGVVKKGTRSYLTKMGTIAIYDADILLDKGTKYVSKFSRVNQAMYKEMKKEILSSIDENDFDQTTDDILYIETSLGTMGMNDLNPIAYDVDDTIDVSQLITFTSIIKRKLENAPA